MTSDPAAPFTASSQARFRELFEQAPVSVQLFGTDRKTLQVNRAWEVLWQGAFGPA